MRRWHADAKQMRAEGLSVAALAAFFGKSRATIRWALDENGEREENRQRVRRNRDIASGVGSSFNNRRHVPKPVTLPTLKCLEAKDAS